jgi:hypothetical protein
MKAQLTQDDLNRLSAARGLDLFANHGRNMEGLKPSVSDYNTAIKKGVYTGSPITPVDRPKLVFPPAEGSLAAIGQALRE